MDQIDAKVFSLISVGTMTVVGLIKKMFPVWTDKKEEALAVALPIAFTVLAKLLHAFQGTDWVNALLFATGGGLAAGVAHDYLLNPVIKSLAKPDASAEKKG